MWLRALKCLLLLMQIVSLASWNHQPSVLIDVLADTGTPQDCQRPHQPKTFGCFVQDHLLLLDVLHWQELGPTSIVSILLDHQCRLR